MDELCMCQGLGEKKVRRLYEAFRKPFSSQRAKRRREDRRKQEEEAGEVPSSEPVGTALERPAGVNQKVGDTDDASSKMSYSAKAGPKESPSANASSDTGLVDP